MKDTINKDKFVAQFLKIRPDNFSPSGLRALFDYFEQLEDDIGEQIEFDPIAICCDYSEHDSLKEVADDYCPDYEDVTIGYFEDRTTVIPIEDTGGFIIQQF